MGFSGRRARLYHLRLILAAGKDDFRAAKALSPQGSASRKAMVIPRKPPPWGKVPLHAGDASSKATLPAIKTKICLFFAFRLQKSFENAEKGGIIMKHIWRSGERKFSPAF